MSDAPQMSLLDQLKFQRAQFAAQKELAQNNLNQLVGAVFACDEMIKNHEAEEVKNESKINLGDHSNVEVNDQIQE